MSDRLSNSTNCICKGCERDRRSYCSNSYGSSLIMSKLQSGRKSRSLPTGWKISGGTNTYS